MSTINEDFEKVKRTIETTTNPAQFRTLFNLVENFGRKWNAKENDTSPEYYGILNTRYGTTTTRLREEAHKMYQYLKLKVDYEKNI